MLSLQNIHEKQCYPMKIHRFLFYKLPYIIIFTMFFTFIWFIFIAYSVSGYHKTFLTFSNIYKCSMKVIIVQLCGQPPLRPIWQLIRVAKVVHLKAIEQPRRTFFVSCFPPRQRQQQQRQHLQVQTNTEEQARTHPYHNRQRHHGIPQRRRQHDVPREQWQHCHTFRAMRRSKEQRSTGGGQWGAGGRMGNGLGLNEQRGNKFVHILYCVAKWINEWATGGPKSGPLGGQREAR
jgi:hypothetical protein